MNPLDTKGNSGRGNSQALPSVLVYTFLENWCGHTPDRYWNRLALTWTVTGSGDIACFCSVYLQGYVVVLPTWDKSPKRNIRIHPRPLNCPSLSSSNIPGTERGVSFTSLISYFSSWFQPRLSGRQGYLLYTLERFWRLTPLGLQTHLSKKVGFKLFRKSSVNTVSGSCCLILVWTSEFALPLCISNH